MRVTDQHPLPGREGDRSAFRAKSRSGKITVDGLEYGVCAAAVAHSHRTSCLCDRKRGKYRVTASLRFREAAIGILKNPRHTSPLLSRKTDFCETGQQDPRSAAEYQHIRIVRASSTPLDCIAARPGVQSGEFSASSVETVSPADRYRFVSG